MTKTDRCTKQCVKITVFIFSVVISTSLCAKDQDSIRTISVSWTHTPPVIDGELTDTVWEQAQVATDFFRAKDGDIQLARLNTEVRILYDENMLYIGIRCDEPNMKTLRETKLRRDSAVWQNDCIEVMIDTYHDHRNCYVFGINTLGTQMDQRVSNESVFELSWNATWESKVKKNPDNWTAELAIPFRVLRFDRNNTIWGINFWRVHPMDGRSFSWARTAFFSRVSEYGNLTGLNFEKIKTVRKVGMLPYSRFRAIENRPVDLSGGLDFIIPISTQLTSNVTFNPDFSQLESDPTRINISSDRELSLPERRPFFLEGAELLDMPLNLLYTRRVQEIDFGAKIAGTAGSSNFTVINTNGKMIDRYDADQKKQANLFAGRVNYDIGERTVIGATGIHKYQTDRSVALLSLNGRFAFHKDLIVTSQHAVDFLNGERHSATYAAVEWIREGWQTEVEVKEIQEGFRPNEMGLEDEAFRRIRGRVRYRFHNPERGLVERFWADTRHSYQFNAENTLKERRNEYRINIDIGRLGFFVFGGFGALREIGRLFDSRFIGSNIVYEAPRWHMDVGYRRGFRRDELNRLTTFSAGANLFGKLQTNIDLDNYYWRTHRNTFVYRLRSNYQLTSKIGWRVYVERVDERLEDFTSYNFNAFFDYEFTPESHFFFVFVNSSSGERAVFTKLAYLFKSSFPGFNQTN